jgi:oxalate decarboxylase
MRILRVRRRHGTSVKGTLETMLRGRYGPWQTQGCSEVPDPTKQRALTHQENTDLSASDAGACFITDAEPFHALRVRSAGVELSGQFNVTMFGSKGRWREEVLSKGDVGYIPQGFGHSIENISGEKARILIVFNNGHCQTIDVSQWIAGNPVGILATNFSQDPGIFEQFPRGDVFLTR